MGSEMCIRDSDYIIAQVPPIVEGLRAMSPVWEKIKDL